jgi:hypothetical protein
MNNLDEVVWPILRFGRPGCMMARYSDAESLCRATVLGIDDLNAMEEHFIIDGRGTRYDMQGATPLSGELKGVKRIVFRLLNPTVSIRYRSVTRGARLSLDEVKALARRDIESDRDYWSETEEPEHLIAKANDATTVEELIKLFD